VVTNRITGASLSSNNVTLPAGTYYVEAYAPCPNQSSDICKIRVRDVTNGVTLAIGTNQENGGTNISTGGSLAWGEFTLAGSANVTVQLFSNGSDKIGTANSSGEAEVYSWMKIWKVA
jgi:hypothetical protein